MLARKYRRYYRQLERLAGITIAHRAYQLQSYDGKHMPFENQTFDAVLSNTVLEHVQDVDAVLRETCRVTKTGGISYHLWHNYYSLSGGHHSQSVYHKHPWGHLRLRYEAPGLNRFTPSQFREFFSRYFDIVGLYQVDGCARKKGFDNNFQFEGEALLSKSIRDELCLPTELMLTRGYLIIGRKRE